MTELAILLVSDLHAGPHNLWSELRTAGHVSKKHVIGPTSPHYSASALVEAAKPLMEQVPPERRVLLCTGDLSSSCQSTELAATAKFLSSLSAGLGVPHDSRFVVPGNHDIDWPLTKLAQKDAWYDGYRQRKVTDLLQLHAEHFQYPINGEMRTARILDGKVTFYLLDSAHEDRANNTPHRGKVGDRQRGALRAELAKDASSLRLVALHHHLVQYAPGHGMPDFSLVEDAGDLRAILEHNAVPVVFHGHQHYPFFQEVSTGSVPLSVIACGSTTQSPPHLPAEIPNTFHVVIFDDLTPTRPKGVIYTRMFSITGGWRTPSIKHHHVPARKPFGAPLNIPEQQLWADEAIQRCIDEKLVHVEPFLRGKPDGDYICPHGFGELIRRRIEAVGLVSTLSVIVDAESDRVVLQTGPEEDA